MVDSALDRGAYVRTTEYLSRLDAVRAILTEAGLDALCLFGTTDIFYFTGFAYQPTERPVCAVIPRDGEAGILVPGLEREHLDGVRATLPVTKEYPEYPGIRHPMHFLAEMMGEMGLAEACLGCDSTGYGGFWGSKGPSLNELLPSAKIQIIRQALWEMRAIKTPAEIAAIRESARWGNLAHRLLQDYTRPGLTELEVGQRASADGSNLVLKAFGERFSMTQWGVAPVHAGYKAGPETAFPHPMAGGRPMEPGDQLVTWVDVFIDGYHAELERTMVLGEPTAEQREFFDLMCRMQEVGFQALRPGQRCCDVDQSVQDFAEKHNLAPFVRHHTGHAFGLEIHEPPYLDLGDRTEIKPGMVFSIEPGLYVPGLGGFRHSDTAIVTENGCEIVTYYPRDIDSLIIPV